MDKNQAFRYLQMGLPEGILRKKMFGDFGGALQDIEMYLSTPDLPFAMRQCLMAEKEMIRRFPSDFPFSKEEAMELVRSEIPDFTEEEFDQLEQESRIRWIYVQGEKRYFDRFFETLCRTDPRIAGRAGKETEPRNEAWFQSAVETMRTTGSAAKRFRCKATLQLKEETFRKGVLVRAYLPIPCACDSQSEICIEQISPEPTAVSSEHAAQRVVFWETRMEENHPFEVCFSYVRKAAYQDLWSRDVQKRRLDTGYQETEYLQEQAPHLVFSPYIKQLTRELTADVSEPLEKARRCYDFVTKQIRYSFMPAYFSLESIAENCARNRIGDCGVQTLLFLTLCRCAGVPAKWESGWAAEPGFCGAHDWARFYAEPYGWLYADVSYGGDAAQRGDEARRRHYFGNLDPYRMTANTAFQTAFEVPKEGWRADPYDNQVGEMEMDGEGLLYEQYIRTKEVLEWKDIS